MTWVLAGTSTLSTEDETLNPIAEVFTNYLSTRTGWVVDAYTEGQQTLTYNYTFTNLLTGQPHTWYFIAKGSYAVESRFYDVTPGDNTTVEEPYCSYGTTNAGQVLRAWYSTENDRDLLITRGQKVAFWHCAQPEYLCWGGPNNPYAWAPGVRREDFCALPAGHSSGFYCSGGPVYVTTPNTQSRYVATVAGYSSSTQSNGQQVLYSSFPLFANADYNSPYGTLSSSQPYVYINQPDIMYHKTQTAAQGDNSGFPSDTSTTALLVQYDGKYWLRTEPNTNENGFLLDFGATEPNFSTAP